jgi:hypothetical protein
MMKETTKLHEVANALNFYNFVFVVTVSGLLCKGLFLYKIPYLTIAVYQWYTFKAHIVMSSSAVPRCTEE